MPDVIINKNRFYNPVDYILRQIGGTWKAPVLWRLKAKTLRYSELEKDIPHISQKMLTKTLKELESDGIILKKTYASVPPRTEYSLTAKGKKIITLVATIRTTGLELMKDEGIDYEALIKEEKKNAVKK
ncbi:MAG: helix-turn-helix domain-containing protein [Bacteroidetes bacterium]|nr:helix-turn-helix domain-containing protein [Bacteroidota bacterium]